MVHADTLREMVATPDHSFERTRTGMRHLAQNEMKANCRMPVRAAQLKR
jgi:hypothetical protein